MRPDAAEVVDEILGIQVRTIFVQEVFGGEGTVISVLSPYGDSTLIAVGLSTSMSDWPLLTSSCFQAEMEEADLESRSALKWNGLGYASRNVNVREYQRRAQHDNSASKLPADEVGGQPNISLHPAPNLPGAERMELVFQALQMPAENLIHSSDLKNALALSNMAWEVEEIALERLRERICQYSPYVLQEVDATGHCQFDALAHQISCRFFRDYANGLETSYWTVRLYLAEWLRRNAQFDLGNGIPISSFLDHVDGIDWPSFCNKVESVEGDPNPLWGNHLTLIAAANRFQRTVRVWTGHEGLQWWFDVKPTQENEAFENPFELAHLPERHYLSVCEPSLRIPGPRRTGDSRWSLAAVKLLDSELSQIAMNSVDLDDLQRPDILLKKIWSPNDPDYDFEKESEPLVREWGDCGLSDSVCFPLLPRWLYVPIARCLAKQTESSNLLNRYVPIQLGRRRRHRPIDQDSAQGTWWELAFGDWCWIPGFVGGQFCACVPDLIFCSGAAPCSAVGRRLSQDERAIVRLRQSQYLLTMMTLPFLSVIEWSDRVVDQGRCTRITLYIYMFALMLTWSCLWIAGWACRGRARWSLGCLILWALIRTSAGVWYPNGFLWAARMSYTWIDPNNQFVRSLDVSNTSDDIRFAARTLAISAFRDACARGSDRNATVAHLL